MIVAEIMGWGIVQMDDRHNDNDQVALYIGTLLLALQRLRFEVRLVAWFCALLLVAFIAHAVFFAAR